MLRVTAAEPQVFAYAFGTRRPAKTVNEDGTINSPDNPALLGSVVSIWATGAGAMSIERPDGAIVSGVLGAPLLPVSMMGFQRDIVLDVRYVGDAPSMVAGALQINFRLPRFGDPFCCFASENHIIVEAILKIGDAVSAPFETWVKP